MKTESQLRRRIMRRVWAVYVLRQVFSPVTRGAVFTFSLFGIFSLVSVKQVIANVPESGAAELFRFFVAAFAHTEPVVQVLTVLALVAGFWFVSGVQTPRLQTAS